MIQHTVNTPYLVGEVHFYTAELNGDLVMFDTGPPTPEGIAYLRNHVDLDRLRYLFVTHCHVDHYGLAAFIEKNSGAEIFIPRNDAIKFRRHEERIGSVGQLLSECGFDKSLYVQLKEVLAKAGVLATMPEQYRLVEESAEVLSALGISYLACPGHCQSDLVYRVGDYAVTGDILLRNIFQAPLLDIDMETVDTRFHNYAAYCRSIIELRKIRGAKILPGHRWNVKSLDDTILFYVRKLLERAGQLRAFPRSESVSEVIARLFPGGVEDPFVVYLKASEIVFMRDFFDDPERLRASLESIGLFGQVRDLYASVAVSKEQFRR